MSAFTNIVQNLSTARATRDQVAGQLFQAKQDLVGIEPEITRTNRKGESLSTIQQTKTAKQVQITSLDAQLAIADSAVLAAQNQLVQLGTPQNLAAEWDDSTPILLLPVRTQYRFQERTITQIKHIPVPSNSGNTGCVGFFVNLWISILNWLYQIFQVTETIVKKELWVRLFPDEIHIDSHEPELTKEEYEAGLSYWNEVWANPTDEEKHKAKWRLFSRQFGPNRAAWICKQTKPTNWPPNAAPPQFPTHTFKQQSWSKAPKSRVMPDRFVIRAYTGTNFKEQVGNSIPMPLVVGPDPQLADSSFEEVGGELKVDPGMEWMVNFEKAVASGMGVRMELTNQEFSGGFDKLIVLGLRQSSDVNESTSLLEQLIDAHHYAPGGGISLVPQNTPTNNTKEAESGFINRIRDDEFTFKLELKAPLFDPNSVTGSAQFNRTDGQLLAEALGIQYETLQHIAFTDRAEVGWARAMNHALYPGTIGYFQKQMLKPLVSKASADLLREFFTQNINGRGNLPVIRVDNQPYGILTTTAFSKMVWGNSPMEQTALGIQNILQPLHAIWNSMTPGVKTVMNTTADWQKMFMEILNLHGGSVEFHQRFEIGPELMWNILNWLKGHSTALAWYNDLQAQGQTIMTSLGFLPQKPRMLNMSHFGDQTKLIGNLVDAMPISDTNPISGTNYIAWLSNTTNLQNIYDENFGAATAPSTLLYLMLRNSYLQECYDTAVRLWYIFGYEVDRTEKEFLHFLKNEEGRPLCDDTRWATVTTEIPNIEKGLSMQKLLFNPLLNSFPNEAKYLLETRESLALLKGLPTAQLERILVDHIDLCTYRFDAWQLGLANYRLATIRSASDPNTRKKGIYLGSFGWLEDVRPGPAHPKVPTTDIPAAFNDNNALPITYEPGNAGSIHAHSVPQAVTGAVLRDNYLAKGGSRMEVNLSSERVRRALDLIEGIQNGQDLGALLGYQFERGLHEGYSSVEMDQYLYPLRNMFPLATMEESPSGQQAPSEARNVVHGLNLLKHYRGHKTYPYGLSFLPTSGSVDANALTGPFDTEFQKLEETIDAIADLTSAEGVYQAVSGNYERASAILNAPGEGKMIPEPEVVQTPRTVVALTQRVGILWDTSSSAAWNSPVTSPRALAEPTLNNWLVEILGPASRLKCKAQYIRDEGTLVEMRIDVEVNAADIEIEPIDLLFMATGNLIDIESELSMRIAYFIRRTYSQNDNTSVKIDYKNRTGWNPEDRSFYEIKLLLVYLVKLINEGRNLHAGDFLLDNEKASFSAPYDNYQLGELGARVIDTFNSLFDPIVGLLQELNAQKNAVLIVDPVNDAVNAKIVIDALRTSLIKAANYGIPIAVPNSSYDVSIESKEKLIGLSEAVDQVLKEREKKASESWPSFLNGTFPQMENTAKAIFGDSFRIFPQFKFINQPELSLAHTNSTNLLQGHSPFAMEEWRFNVSKVREKIKAYSLVAFQTEMLHEGTTPSQPLAFDFYPIQLPYNPDTAQRWLGLEYPDTQKVDKDTLSLVLNLHNGFDSNQNTPRAGLLIDEWVEEIPTNEETTGIAFNYHEPQMEPPQTLLLAVTPKITGAWDWDDLMDTLTETLNLAKKRAVSPEQIGQTGLAQLLPAIMAPIASKDNETFTTDFRKNNQ